jgi:hypothetical protein
MDRLSVELSRTMENLDVTEVFAQLVEGRTIEVKAEIRLKPRDEEAPVASGSRGKDA